MITDCDPSRSSKYGTYWSDHQLWSQLIGGTVPLQRNIDLYGGLCEVVKLSSKSCGSTRTYRMFPRLLSQL